MLTTMTVRRFALILALLAIGGCSSTSSSKAPLQSHDGLQLVPGTKFAEVYEKPGIDISHYSEFGVTPCQVAFKNNWLATVSRKKTLIASRTASALLATQYFAKHCSKTRLITSSRNSRRANRC